MVKLHLGCGRNIINGWDNLDLVPEPGARQWDANIGFYWLGGDCVDFIYSEHFIEHVPYETAQKIFSEAHRVLKPGGVMRISTPDLNTIVRMAYQNDWQGKHDAVGWHPKTCAQYINEAFRSWGHQFIYNANEFLLMADKAKFKGVRFPAYRVSAHVALSGLETRPDYEDLIVEVTKI